MRITTLLILTILACVASLLLGACSSPTSTPSDTLIIPTKAQPEATPTEEPAPTATTAPSPTPEPASANEPIILIDGLDRDIVLEEPAQKIVSLAPSNTEILFAIGAGGQVIGRDSFSDYPDEALEVTDVGGGWGEIDLETIVSMEPDLVLMAEINASEQVQTLEDLGLKVYYLTNPLDLNGMYANLRIVAQLTGHEAETEDLIETLSDRVTAVEEKVTGVEERPLIFYELDGSDPNAPWTSGPGTYIDVLITMAGGSNLGNILEGEWAQISVEELVTQNPDLILLGDYIWGGVTPEDVAARAGWDGIAAVQNGQVYPFDDNLVSRPGPRLVEGLEELANLVHPELFQ